MRIFLLLPPFFICVLILGIPLSIIVFILIFWAAAEDRKKVGGQALIGGGQILKDQEEARSKCRKTQIKEYRNRFIESDTFEGSKQTSLSSNGLPIKRVSARKPMIKKVVVKKPSVG